MLGAAAERRASDRRERQGGGSLVLDGIERRWGKRNVLKGVSLSVDPGTVVWLGGENGAGKTTLLRIAAGLILPHGGSVSLCGLHPQRDVRAYQRRLGYQGAGDRALYARLTVRQNLEFWAGLALLARGDRKASVQAAIARFDLHELARSRVDRISTGQRQRVRLAMTFLHEPSLVLLDEPHTSLDDRGLELLDAALDELTARDGAALWCSPAVRNLPVRNDLRYELVDGRATRL